MYTIEEIKNRILQGDSLQVLKTLPSESVDCLITSPPYWGLRDYKTEGIIWDEKENCEHEWNTNKIKWHSDRGKGKRKEVFDDSFQVEGTPSSFCQKCNAWKGQLGQEPTIDLYINHLIQIFNECKRILKKEGACWVVLGDSYSTTTGGKHGFNATVGNTKRDIQSRCVSKEVSEKSLCLIPERFALKMIENKWILRNKIIWYKPNCMPSSAKDRFTVDYENIYFFTKSQKYYFKTQFEPFQSNEQIIYKMNLTKNNIPYVIKPSEKKPYAVQERCGIVEYRKLPDITKFKIFINQQRKKYGYTVEFIEKQVFKNQAPHHWFSGESYPSVEDWYKLKQVLFIPKNNEFEKAMTKQYYKPAEKMSYPQGRIKRCVWSINTKPFPEAHFAVFPPELVKQCLDAGCPPSGIVLDIFMGSGTTALVALKNAMNFVGIELNPDYIIMAQKRLEPYLKQEKLTQFTTK